MSEHHHTPVSVDEEFIFTSQARTKMIGAIVLGLILLALGIFLVANASHEVGHGGAHAAAAGGHEAFHWTKQLWANLWLNNVYFTGLTIVGVFFIAFQYVSYAGWSAPIIRIPMAFGNFLPIAGVLALVYFLAGHHDLFHWTHSQLYVEKLANGQPNPEYDEILVGKSGYLNMPFYITRLVVYFVLWYLMFVLIRKQSFQEDIHGGTSYWHKNTVLSTIFIIIFGVTSSTAAWDWIMSIDPHWFSTLFGWYMFASWFVAGLSAITLTVVLLKENGYLKVVTENHIHDLGKFMFAFSIFWTYLWFAQFLLIYYANLSEETIYFLERFRGHGGIYKPLFFANLFLNFCFPFLVLMTRDAKRQLIFLKIACIVILLGHWLDFYLMVMPATVGSHGGIGIMEIGTLLVYAGAFMLVVASSLTKANLIAKNHPMLEESMHHHI